MSFDAMDDVERGGTALALLGGLLGLTPVLQRLLRFGPGWTGLFGITLVAAGVLAGAILAIAGYRALGGLLAGSTGFVLLVFGPTTAGVLGFLGGLLLFLGAGQSTAGEPASPGREATMEG